MVFKINYKLAVMIGMMVCIVLVFFIIRGLTAENENTFTDTSDKIKLPIIMYHEIRKTNTGKDIITPSEFESDLKFLEENDYHTITMADLIAYVYDNKDLPENPIMLTFDDGYYNNYIYGFPLLQKYDIKIVLSIIGKGVDDFSRIKDENVNYSHTSWEQINEMLNDGRIEIQNHSYNLHQVKIGRYGSKKSFGESLDHYERVLTEDIGRLQNDIFLMTGQTPTTFTYPFGSVSKDSVPILKKMGFKASLSCKFGINLIEKDPEKLFGLKRICRPHGVSLEKSIQKAMKTIKSKKE